MLQEDVAAVHTPMFPYADGSGFALMVSVLREDDERPFVLLKGGNDRVRFDVSKWPAIRAELDRMIAFMTGSPEAPSEQVQGQGEK